MSKEKKAIRNLQFIALIWYVILALIPYIYMSCGPYSIHFAFSIYIAFTERVSRAPVCIVSHAEAAHSLPLSTTSVLFIVTKTNFHHTLVHQAKQRLRNPWNFCMLRERLKGLSHRGKTLRRATTQLKLAHSAHQRRKYRFCWWQNILLWCEFQRVGPSPLMCDSPFRCRFSCLNLRSRTTSFSMRKQYPHKSSGF